jgi:putative ABC transport system ATP-binding protein
MVALFQTAAPGKALRPAEKPLDEQVRAVDISGLRFSWSVLSAAVLDIDSLQIDKGRRLFIEGPSGSGKSTLLALLAGIMKPQAGRVSVLGHALDEMHGPARDRFRSDHMGIIFQMFNLIPYLTVTENVTLPCRFSRRRLERAGRSGDAASEALRLLSRLSMADPELLRRPVTELSVGQQQRVAAARALMGAPEIIIADEPTSSLDADHRKDFIELLFEECGREDTTLVFVSHDTSLAPMFDRTARLTEINRADLPAATRERGRP